jgi:cellulose synthase/poly-beta-1,6-N-acetylglucosamine synthase-like glycosyltransferase
MNPAAAADLTPPPDEENTDVRPATHRLRSHSPRHRRPRRDRDRHPAAQARPPLTTVTALIPAHNETANLRECLASIQAQTRPVDQIVVVADRCTDDTATVAREAGAVVVEVDCGAKAAAQNAGLPYVTGDVVLCVDADTVLASDVTELFLAELQRVDATCANMLPRPEQRGFWVANRRFAYALGRYWWRWCQGQVGRLMVLSGCAYAVRADALRTLGGFPGGLITCDMDLTWALYGAGYRTSFCHRALAYTYDPETTRVYTAQMRRWASGFFQNFARHRRQLASPASALVVGSLLYDLLTLPIAYGMATVWAWHHPASQRWILGWLAIHALVTIAIASRTVGWRRAAASYPAYWLVNWYNKALYLWTFTREWVLGRHYASWTGRQGRGTVITPMSYERRCVLATLVSAAGITIVLASLGRPAGVAVGTAALAVAGGLLWPRRSKAVTT